MITTSDTTDVANAVPLRLQQVVKRYGGYIVVDQLDLEVRRGEIIALLGPNGAGKSTTISMALGFVSPESGTVFISGSDIAKERAAVSAHVGYIPENVQLYPLLTGLENVEYFAALSGSTASRKELCSALTLAGLPAEAHDRQVGDYSKGMRQKTGIAIAMMRHCRLLLLDEPTSGLDPFATDEFNGLLRQAAERGVGILMATHDIAGARAVADRVLIMRGGKIIASYETHEAEMQQLEDIYLAMMKEMR